MPGIARLGWAVDTAAMFGLNLIALPDTLGSYFRLSSPELADLHRVPIRRTN
jgi:hypothetical protein